ncbi:restriction endonuclease subunit S [Nonomuraea pusilla]|uniref:Type I restriction enzyme, S subunit n=1 Tax=Nonomuraea pusilla TaxID=46177 RepID=A0A1H8JV94_9ACTN|nr:restriction endonuclease subunit S [Nonomuraea pusilla]SEN84650.1 type I restriction enzyme, S subunit [Nonomuraea pusilla]
MSRIDDLITELAPKGVPIKPLGEVGSFIRGRRFTKADRVDDGLPSIHYGEIYTHYGVATSDTISHLRADLAPTLRFAQPGDVIIAAVGETVEDVGKAVAWLGTEQVAVHDDCFIFRSSLDPKFVVYFMQSDAFNKAKEAFVARAKVKRLSGSGLARLRIPLPPIEVQREIVRVLDSFQLLEAELVEELEARKQQRLAFAYALPETPHIRALSSGTTEHVRLGEISTPYVESLRVQADETYTNLGVKWYGEGVFARESKPGSAIKGTTLYRVKPGQFIYNRMFVIEGSFAVVPPELAHGVVSSEFPVYDLDSSRVLPEWLLLYFQDEYTLKRVSAEVTGVERGSTKSRRRWKQEQFEAFQIELPSVPAQRELLRVLGTVTALESALRDELVARRKQFAYYRDKLLTFEELLV